MLVAAPGALIEGVRAKDVQPFSHELVGVRVSFFFSKKRNGSQLITPQGFMLNLEANTLSYRTFAILPLAGFPLGGITLFNATFLSATEIRGNLSFNNLKQDFVFKRPPNGVGFWCGTAADPALSTSLVWQPASTTNAPPTAPPTPAPSIYITSSSTGSGDFPWLVVAIVGGVVLLLICLV